MFDDCLKIEVVLIFLFIVSEQIVNKCFYSLLYTYQTNDRIKEIGFCKSIFVLI